MAVKRGDNAGVHEVLYIIADGAEEMAAFESLGPRTRQALRDAPMKTSATSIVDQLAQKSDEARQRCEAAGMPWPGPFNPHDPRLDGMIAAGIVGQSTIVLMRDRSRADAELGVKPIRPRRVRVGRKRFV